MDYRRAVPAAQLLKPRSYTVSNMSIQRSLLVRLGGIVLAAPDYLSFGFRRNNHPSNRSTSKR